MALADVHPRMPVGQRGDGDVGPRGARPHRWSLLRFALDARQEQLLSLLRATGILCVYGSGFGTAPEEGFFRVVFLASPAELGTIYDDIATFTRDYLR